MIKLYSRKIEPISDVKCQKGVYKLTTNPNIPKPIRKKQILLIKDSSIKNLQSGFKAYFYFDNKSNKKIFKNSFLLGEELNYLENGDIIRFDPTGKSIRSLYRINSKQNYLLVTERCNSYCLMCSQPPKDIDDSHLIKELLEIIPLMDRRTNEITITGGEPTLLNNDLITIIMSLKHYLPTTSIHILTNGRYFKKEKYVRKISEIDHYDLMWGIPLYSDISNIHDYVVQADGAYDETVKGILNLKKYNQKVEIRVVIHRQTFSRLPKLANFIARNLLFVDHVALMGLENMGFAKPNIDLLWIDPIEYQNELVEAVEILSHYKMNVSIYNHQLCLLNPKLYQYNRKSISDWKNVYMPECDGCVMREECGGFFSSAKFRYSKNIKPFDKKV